jgi:hypothetical protein
MEVHRRVCVEDCSVSRVRTWRQSSLLAAAAAAVAAIAVNVRTPRLICENETLNAATVAGSVGASISGTSDLPSFAAIGGSPAASRSVGKTSINDAKPLVDDPFT